MTPTQLQYFNTGGSPVAWKDFYQSRREYLDQRSEKLDPALWAEQYGHWSQCPAYPIFYECSKGENVLIFNAVAPYFHDLHNEVQIESTLLPHQDHLPEHIVIALAVEETSEWQSLYRVLLNYRKILDRLKQNNRIKEYTIIVSEQHGRDNLDKIKDLPNVVVFPWFLIAYYYVYPEKFEFLPSDNHKPLYLPGKILKYHRVGPIVSLKESGHLDNFLYTFIGVPFGEDNIQTPHNWIEKIILELKEYGINWQDIAEDTAGLFDYMSNLTIDLDGMLSKSIKEKSLWMKKVGPEIYDKTSVELVSETFWTKNNHITEKTWRPIFAGKPFIQIGRQFNKCIEETGFRTFDKYCNIPGPDTTWNFPEKSWPEGTIRAECEYGINKALNLSELIQTNTDIKEQVYNDTIYNREHAVKLCETFLQIMQDRHNFEAETMESLFTITSRWHLW